MGSQPPAISREDSIAGEAVSQKPSVRQVQLQYKCEAQKGNDRHRQGQKEAMVALFECKVICRVGR